MARLHTEYYTQSNNAHQISAMDQLIREYINQYPSGDYDEVLRQDSKWDVFFHLSSMRASILNWYEFRKDAEILEIGGEFGALTGLLTDRCVHVTTTEQSLFRAESICARYSDKTNLDVYAGEVEDMSFGKKFDYIVLIGILERQGNGTSDKQLYANYLSRLQPLLKPNGRLLVAVENRYGIRYFCGTPEPHTGQVFDGINRYPQGTKGYSFSRQELIHILGMAGVADHKFYYPLPDYKLPQLIYSEVYLPDKNLQERLIPYYVNRNALLAYENELYDDLIDNGVFEFFSNSFLVECALDGQFSSVIYAAVSADRSKENAFATTIHLHGEVKKTPLYPEGETSSAGLYQRMMELKNRGIDIVPHEVNRNALVMPYISSQTLSNYLKKAVLTDPQQFIGIFDRLYEVILASSEATAPDNNALNTEGSEGLDFGIILEKAFLELIPLNSFYTDGGEILFYDQEFVKENYPAKYVLFRALHYMYAFAPHAEGIIPLQFMKEKYGMTELWDIFLVEERRFLADIRKHEQHHHFYSWARVDKQQMMLNAKYLAGDSEAAEKYEVSEKMQKIWAVQLDLLSTFMEVCKEHSLKYFAIYGTLLGAVRHRGFIPWDDDVDIAMPREDYDKLKEIASSSFGEPYFLQTTENSPDAFYGGFCRLRNSNTTGIGLMDIGHEGNQGIWIDILPIDTCTVDARKLQKKVKKIHKIQNLLYAKVYGRDYEKFRGLSKWEWKLYQYAAKGYSHKRLSRKLDRMLMLYGEEGSDYLAIFTHYNRHQALDRRDFAESVLLDFAGVKLPVPSGYKRCLEMTMGKDYMTYPAAEQRKPHHPGIFDPDQPYKKYKNLFFDIFDDCRGKKIIVFGAGLMFEDYMRKYGDRYRPAFLVDNDKAKWGIRRQNIEIKSPREILEIPLDQRRVIICSVHYRQIEEQLKKMGVNDYRIYVQEKEWIMKDEEQGR